MTTIVSTLAGARRGCREQRHRAGQRSRQRRARWSMPWSAPPFRYLVGHGITIGSGAGMIAGTLVFPGLGTAFGAAGGFLTSLFVAPVVGGVLAVTRGGSVGAALRRAQLAAAAATIVVFEVIGPVVFVGRVGPLDGLYPIGGAIAVAASFIATRVLVTHAYRRVLGSSSA